MVPAMERLPGLRERLDGMEYFAVCGPPETGKTTALMGAAEQLTAEGRFAALHVSCLDGRQWHGNTADAHRAVLGAIQEISLVRLPAPLRPPAREPPGEEGLFLGHLSAWAAACPRPVVLFLDDAGALAPGALGSLLAQLRAGGARRPSGFPLSIVLCGRRDVLAPERRGDPSSPLAAPLRMGNFTFEQVRALYQQHTQETGQAFTAEAIAAAFELTSGQPRLVNVLARDIVEGMGVPATTAITAQHVLEARDRLVRQLGELDGWAIEPGVRRVLQAVLAGSAGASTLRRGDLALARARGFTAPDPPLRIANPILRERLARAPGLGAQRRMTERPGRFLLPDGRLAFRRMLRAFAVFWRKHGAALVRESVRPDEAPLAVLRAFVARILDGWEEGSLAQVPRRGPTCHELTLCYTRPDGTTAVQRRLLDVRVWKEGQSDRARLGTLRLDRNLPRLGFSRGTLVILDVRGKIGERAPRFEDITTPRGYEVLLVHV